MKLTFSKFHILRDCVNGFNFDDKSFKNDLLPNAIQNILVLARKFQEKHVRSKGVSFLILIIEYSKQKVTKCLAFR